MTGLRGFAMSDNAVARRDRRGEPTIQISLRLPTSWMALLRQRALAAAAREDCMITPQEIVRRIIEDALNQTEA